VYLIISVLTISVGIFGVSVYVQRHHGEIFPKPVRGKELSINVPIYLNKINVRMLENLTRI
jgi:hypothetical protein